MSSSIYVFTIFMVLSTILLIFGMRYLALARQTRSRLANEDAYRDLLSKATSAQSQTAMSLSSVQMTMSDINSRLAAVEKLLSEIG